MPPSEGAAWLVPQGPITQRADAKLTEQQSQSYQLLQYPP